jgi:hypothetical protein
MIAISFGHTHGRALAAVLLALALISPAANAQSTGGAQSFSQPPQANSPGPREEHSDWSNEKFERQEFREEMEKIRKEHEDLESARDKLLDQCVNATGAQATDCERQKQALHEWHDRLHERMRALRDKMEAAHRDHLENGMGGMNGTQEQGNNKPWPHASGNAQPALPTTQPPPAP